MVINRGSDLLYLGCGNGDKPAFFWNFCHKNLPPLFKLSSLVHFGRIYGYLTKQKQAWACFNCIQCVQWQSRSCLSEKARQLVRFRSFRYWTDLLNIFVNLARDGCVGELGTLIGYLKTILDWYFMPGSANITLRGRIVEIQIFT